MARLHFKYSIQENSSIIIIIMNDQLREVNFSFEISILNIKYRLFHA